VLLLSHDDKDLLPGLLQPQLLLLVLLVPLTPPLLLLFLWLVPVSLLLWLFSSSTSLGGC
jgi:hypothetical protein